MEKTLVVLFPGFDCNPESPLMHGAAECAKACGFDVAPAVYKEMDTDEKHGYQQRAVRSMEGAMEGALCTIEEAGDYDKLFFVSKGFGTLVAGEVGQIMRRKGKEVYQIYLTPMAMTYMYYMRSGNCTAIVGQEDEMVTSEALEWMKTDARVDLLVIDGANHAMECPDNAEATAEALKKVTEKILEVFKRTPEEEKEQ